MFDLANIAKTIEQTLSPETAKSAAKNAAEAVGLPAPAEVKEATAAAKAAADSSKAASDAALRTGKVILGATVAVVVVSAALLLRAVKR